MFTTTLHWIVHALQVILIVATFFWSWENGCFTFSFDKNCFITNPEVQEELEKFNGSKSKNYYNLGIEIP